MNDQPVRTSPGKRLSGIFGSKQAIAALCLICAAAIGTTAFVLSTPAKEAEIPTPVQTTAAVEAETPEAIAEVISREAIPVYFDRVEDETDFPITPERETGTEAVLPETELPETLPPETAAPETAAPETKAPETKAPETKAPETKAPETKAPETEAPETKAPETKAPETETSETKAPETEEAKETKAAKEYTYVIFPEDVIPLSKKRQEYAIKIAKEYGFEVELLYGIMRVESHFLTDVISSTDDYGIMQINKINHDMMRRHLGLTDMMDYEQNVRAGAYMLSLCKKAHTNLSKMLMCYNRGIEEAEQAFKKGITSDKYSKKVLDAMQVYVDYKNAHLL